MVVEGPSAVKIVRRMMGATNPLEAEPGTVRGDFGLDIRRNVVHSADSLESAKREIEIFFPEGQSSSSGVPMRRPASISAGLPPHPGFRSPRRRLLLSDIGVPFVVVPSQADEAIQGERCGSGRGERLPR